MVTYSPNHGVLMLLTSICSLTLRNALREAEETKITAETNILVEVVVGDHQTAALAEAVIQEANLNTSLGHGELRMPSGAT